MIHVGIDYHKKSSHFVVMDGSGQVRWDGDMPSCRESFEALKASLPPGEPVQSALEAGPNWGVPFDILEELGLNPKLSNPLRTKLIGESYVKTDKIDATVIATLLRANVLPLVHVPTREIRAQKNLLRQRLWLVKLQTTIKNRTHALVDRNHVRPPKVADLFGSQGRAWLNALDLPHPDGDLLMADLALLDTVRSHIHQAEKWIAAELKTNPYIPILESLPGIGKLLAALAALEIGTIDRFATPEKFCSYSGLSCSTYKTGGRGGKTFHGGLIPTCNHHLRYAFIEAAWTAMRVSPHFSAYYWRLRYAKKSSEAIPAVARKLCVIAWHCLKKGRHYVEKPYQPRLRRVEHVAISGKVAKAAGHPNGSGAPLIGGRRVRPADDRRALV